MNLEWLKKHKAAAIGGGVALLVVIYLLFRNNANSGSSLGSAIAQQNQGQLQMAELNAQESASSTQAQAQLAASEYSTQAQEQEAQDQTVGSLASEIVPQQLESGIYAQEIAAQEQEQESLIPLENEALSISKQGNRAVTGVNELGLLLGEGSIPSFNSEAGVNAQQPNPLNLLITGPLNTATQGLFG